MIALPVMMEYHIIVVRLINLFPVVFSQDLRSEIPDSFRPTESTYVSRAKTEPRLTVSSR